MSYENGMLRYLCQLWCDMKACVISVVTELQVLETSSWWLTAFIIKQSMFTGRLVENKGINFFPHSSSHSSWILFRDPCEVQSKVRYWRWLGKTLCERTSLAFRNGQGFHVGSILFLVEALECRENSSHHGGRVWPCRVWRNDCQWF